MSESLMTKGYVHSPVPREEQEDERRQQIRFCEFAKDAGRWTTRESAEIDQNYLNKVGIEIPSANGGTYTIKDFEVEELSPDRYVIFAQAPFIIRDWLNREAIMWGVGRRKSGAGHERHRHESCF